MKFDIITIFPKIFDSYFNESILSRAKKKKLITIKTHDLRPFAQDKHRMTDDTPYGGGAGMVMKAEPVLKAVEHIKRQITSKKTKRKVVILSAKGKQFTQREASIWAKKYNQLIFVSGRYEGIDERVKIALRAEEVSIGPYVLTDGDVAVMTIISAVSRLIPGVIKLKSLQEESHGNLILKNEKQSKLEYPHYTKPEIIIWKGKKYRVPKILLSGNHKKIKEWRDHKSV